MKVILLAPYDFRFMKGNTIRPALQCLGLIKNDFHSFELRLRVPNSSVAYKQSMLRRGFWSWIPKVIRPLGVSNYLFDMPFIRKIKVDSEHTIVHAHNFYSFFLLPKKCIKVADFHTFKYNEMYYNYSNPNKKDKFLKKWVYKNLFAPIVKMLEYKICREADRIIVASSNIGEILAEVFKIPKEKFVVINNTVDTDAFSVNQHKEPFRVGVVGSFKDQLNREVLQEVLKMASLTSMEIVLIGGILKEDAELFENIQNVSVLGEVSDKDYKEWMSTISVLLAPYGTHRHGGGSRNKLIEAAISATPIVATSAGAEGFGGDNLLCIGESIPTLIQQLESLQDASVRRNFGGRLRAYALENFSCEKVGKKLKEFYLSLLPTEKYLPAE